MKLKIIRIEYLGVNKKMCKCESCLTDTWLYEGEFFEVEGISKEVYCNECLANIFQEDPTVIKSIRRIEDTF